MNPWYFLLTPLVVLAVMLLFRFVGCASLLHLEGLQYTQTSYAASVKSDLPVAYWRLQEKPPPPLPGTTAVDETLVFPGKYEQAPNKLSVDVPRKSPEADPIILEGGAPGLILDTTATAIKVQGGFVRVQLPAGQPLNPPAFTIEALVSPDPKLLQKLGRFHCVIESSDQPTQAGARKKFGYAIYAGPDDPNNSQSPYHWQLWVGTGSEFKRCAEVTPYDPVTDPITGEKNLGPQLSVKDFPTYLVATFNGSEGALFVYSKNRNLDFLKYKVRLSLPDSYQPNTNGGDLFIGVSGQHQALFGAFPGSSHFLYPFWGEIQEVAVYDKVLGEARLVEHGHAALGLRV